MCSFFRFFFVAIAKATHRTVYHDHRLTHFFPGDLQVIPPPRRQGLQRAPPPRRIPVPTTTGTNNRRARDGLPGWWLAPWWAWLWVCSDCGMGIARCDRRRNCRRWRQCLTNRMATTSFNPRGCRCSSPRMWSWIRRQMGSIRSLDEGGGCIHVKKESGLVFGLRIYIMSSCWG